MSSQTSTITVPHTPQELEQAVKRYQTSDLSGLELLVLWQAIRDASLDRDLLMEPEIQQVPGEDSY